MAGTLTFAAAAVPKAKAAAGNFWLVKTGVGASSAAEVQNLPAGQKPLAANWGGAVYLGSTVAASRTAIANAAKKLGVPSPTNVPSLSFSLGVIGAEVGGAAAVAAAAPGAAAVEAATNVGEAGAAGRRGGRGRRRRGRRDRGGGDRGQFATVEADRWGSDRGADLRVRRPAVGGRWWRRAGAAWRGRDREGHGRGAGTVRGMGLITQGFAMGRLALRKLDELLEQVAEIKRLLEEEGQR